MARSSACGTANIAGFPPCPPDNRVQENLLGIGTGAHPRRALPADDTGETAAQQGNRLFAPTAPSQSALTETADANYPRFGLGRVTAALGLFAGGYWRSEREKKEDKD